MRTLIIVAALCGVLFAKDDVNVSNQGNIGGDIHQTVNINNQDNIANINDFNGWDSWDSICDYNRGLFATRLFSKKACVVTKMNKAAFPTLAQLSKAVQEKKAPGDAPPPRQLTYAVIHTPVSDVKEYGSHIEALCRGLPTYSAAETEGNQGVCRWTLQPKVHSVNATSPCQFKRFVVSEPLKVWPGPELYSAFASCSSSSIITILGITMCW